MIYRTTYNSPAGTLILTAKEDALTGLRFDGQENFSAVQDENFVKNQDCEILDKTKKWLDGYFSGENPEISELNLAPSGSEFAKSVWKLLCGIPYGKTVTYGDLAEKIAEQRGIKIMSAQAIGGAVGRNPVAIIIPCHRVIGHDGSMTGYAAGINKKEKLLDIEKHFVLK